MQEAWLNLALERAGFSSLGDFLAAQGISEAAAEMALTPYLVGYDLWRVQKGDTFSSIAARFGTTAQAIETANPGKQPQRLQIGQLLVVPLGFPVVPENTPMDYGLLRYVLRGLEARYPNLKESVIGESACGRKLYRLTVGTGARKVYYNASHHANEWITTPVVLACLEKTLEAASRGQTLLCMNPAELLGEAALSVVPMVNPDGVDLVTGSATAQERGAAEKIAENYPDIPFPNGWKANLRGVDLNLNYPALWDQAKEIKYERGFTSPAPRDYVGPEPLSENESRAMFDTTETLNPDLTIAWHTQGGEIYWKFQDLAPAGARALGERMAAASGYGLEEIPYASSFAGYKDWFIQDFDRPGYTIEAGRGENPLPISQLPEMVRDNLPIFLLGLTEPPAEAEAAPTGLQTGAVRPKPKQPGRLPGGGGMEKTWG